MDCNIYFFWCFTEGERGGWSGWNWVIDKETKGKKFRQKARYFNRHKRKQDKKSWERSQKIYLIHCSILYCLKLAILKMAEIKERPLIWFRCPWLFYFCCISACYLVLSLSLYSSCPQLEQLKTFLKASQACLTRWVTFSGSRGTSPTCQGQSSGGLKIPFSGPPPHHLPTSSPPPHRWGSANLETSILSRGDKGRRRRQFQLPSLSFSITLSLFSSCLLFLFQIPFLSFSILT